MASQTIMEDYLNFTLSLLTASDPTDPSTRRWKGGTDRSWCAPTAPLTNNGLAIKPTPPQVCVDRSVWQETDIELINTMLGYAPGVQKTVQRTANNAVSTKDNPSGHPGYAYFQLVEYNPVTSTPIGSPAENCYLEVANTIKPTWVKPKTVTDCSQSTTEQQCESVTNCSWVSNTCTDKLYQCSVDMPAVETYTSTPQCSQLKKEACSGTQCTWDTSKNECAPVCSALTNQADCQNTENGYCTWDENAQACKKTINPTPCGTCVSITTNNIDCNTKTTADGKNICKWSDGKCAPITGTCSCQPTSDVKGTPLSECIKSCSYPLAPTENYVRGLKAHFISTLDANGNVVSPPPSINLFPVRPAQGGIPDTLFFISDYTSEYKYYRITLSTDEYGQTKQLSGKCYSAAQGGWQPFNPPNISSGCLGSELYTLQYTVTQKYIIQISTKCSRPKSCPTCYGVGSSQASDPSCTYGHAPFCYPPDDHNKYCSSFSNTNLDNNYFIPFFYFMMNSPKWLNKCCNFNPQTTYEVDDTLKYFCSVRGDKETISTDTQIPTYTLDPNSDLPPPLCDLRMAQLCNSDDPNMSNNIGIDECSCLQRSNTTIMDKPLYQYLSDNLNIPPTCLSGACDPSVSYVPSDLRKQICPNICSSILEVNSNGMANVEIDGVNMSVWCDQTTGTVSLSSESPLLASESTSNKSGNNNNNNNNNNWVVYLLVILIVVLGVLIIFYSI